MICGLLADDYRPELEVPLASAIQRIYESVLIRKREMPHKTGSDVRKPCLLFLDAYDSFTNNIVALIELHLGANITVVKIDDKRYLKNPVAFGALLSRFDAVVAGPGPGSPSIPKDVGLIHQLWNLPEKNLLPVLGICLGFQSLAYAHGASIERLKEPRHGIIASLTHCESSIFSNVDEAEVVHYQSLHARIDRCPQETLLRKARDSSWTTSATCPSLTPLAWTLTDRENGPILMAVAHKTKPFWGLQFHLESVCTSFSGASIIRNWWTEAQKWRILNNKLRLPGDVHQSKLKEKFDFGPPHALFPTGLEGLPKISAVPEHRYMTHEFRLVQSVTTPVRGLEVAQIYEALRDRHGRVLLLESGTTSTGNPVNSETGRYSIFGIVEAGKSEHVLYFTKGKRLIHVNGPKRIIRDNVSNVWEYLKKHMSRNKAIGGPAASPFWGGMIGFASYEACLETIDVPPSRTSPARPDIHFTFIERSVVLDHVEGVAYAQSIQSQRDPWLVETKAILTDLSLTFSKRREFSPNSAASASPNVQKTAEREREPTEQAYHSKIRKCQSKIRAGDSYELCLTDKTSLWSSASKIQTPEASSWSLYRRLRLINPAPFAAYLHFPQTAIPSRTDGGQIPSISIPSLSILSSSPERFLSWTRDGRAQLRPIKGTVAKSPGMTRARAESILSTSKERAENLMIVDLIRHDLHGVVGAGNVTVSKLMQVEEYESVFQLVSVIEGQIDKNVQKQGIDVLAASLPPGSMTGAPKKRSCELLQDIEEDRPRGIYSGVMGYLDVGGGGDFAVVIRTAWSWGDEDRVEAGANPEERSSLWHIGAGGAVTSQSTEQGEWEEMLTKRAALLRLFDGRHDI